MLVAYYAVFNYDEYDVNNKKHGISILFPDIPEANTCAKSDSEGLEMALDVLQLSLIDKDLNNLPKPTPLNKIKLNKNEKAVLIKYNTDDIDLSKFKIY